MVRLISFFLIVVVVMRLLQSVPAVGGIFHGLIGFWLVAILVSLALTRASLWWSQQQRLERQLAELQHVESARNLGKLGSLYLSAGRPRFAVDPLRKAIEADPENTEWRFRLGCALLDLSKFEEASAELASVLAVDEEYGYGSAMMKTGEALTQIGRHAEAVQALERFERNHGANAQSAYRIGRAQKLMGEKQQAKQSFSRAMQLGRKAKGFQRKQSARWGARAMWDKWMTV